MYLLLLCHKSRVAGDVALLTLAVNGPDDDTFTMYTKCIYAGTCRCAVSPVQCNSETCEWEVRVEVPYVFYEIFCISIHRTREQPLQLSRYIIDMHFYLSHSTTESRWFAFKSHGSTISAVRNLFQNMVLFRQVMVDKIIWVISYSFAIAIVVDTIWLKCTFCILKNMSMWQSLHMVRNNNLLSNSYLHQETA